jgi:hypothetical protein
MKQEGKDICYDCGVVQDYQTMKDVDESFAIYCDTCHPVNNVANKVYRNIYRACGKKTGISNVLGDYISFWRQMNEPALKELKEIQEILDTNSVRTDWTDDEVSMETDFLYGKVNKLIKSLDNTE